MKKKLYDEINELVERIIEKCAIIARNPHSDKVGAIKGEEPRAVGEKIADAIRKEMSYEFTYKCLGCGKEIKMPCYLSPKIEHNHLCTDKKVGKMVFID